jgi:hypothetical protein
VCGENKTEASKWTSCCFTTAGWGGDGHPRKATWPETCLAASGPQVRVRAFVFFHFLLLIQLLLVFIIFFCFYNTTSISIYIYMNIYIIFF